MSNREQVGYFRPLCPKHRVVMVAEASAAEGEQDSGEWERKERSFAALRMTGERGASRSRECPLKGCLEKYAPDFGYFTVVSNDDHWIATDSKSVRIARRGTQVICGEHKEAMFIASFADVNPDLARYRCPQKGCGQTMEIVMGGPATYWLGEGYFRVG